MEGLLCLICERTITHDFANHYFSSNTMRPIPDVDQLDVVFGCKAMNILPPMSEIPEDFKRWQNNKWVKVVEDWFFRGLANCQWKPKPGVDSSKAVNAVSACMGSFEPAHEHKTAGCAFLLSEWFEDVTYTVAKKK